jgi:ABC-type enterochelin transport system ATPase subunit
VPALQSVNAQIRRTPVRPFRGATRANQSGLLSTAGQPIVRAMGLPQQTVPLTPEQVADLSQKLSDLRHNINNHLALMVAALELIRRKPEAAARMINNLNEQPQKILEDIKIFSDQFHKALGITEE